MDYLRRKNTPHGGRKTRPFRLGALLALVLLIAVFTFRTQYGPPSENPPPLAEPEAAAVNFDFYRLLKESEVVVEIDEEERISAEPIWLLQAGVFGNKKSARRRQREIAATGLEAAVEEAGKRQYRIILGPFISREKIQQARQLLRRRGIDTISFLKEEEK